MNLAQIQTEIKEDHSKWYIYDYININLSNDFIGGPNFENNNLENVCLLKIINL